MGRRLFLIVVVVLAAAAGAAWWWARASLPALDGEYPASGLTAPVEVLFDGHGVPHVYASGPEDAWFVAGVLHDLPDPHPIRQDRQASRGVLELEELVLLLEEEAELLGDFGHDLDEVVHDIGTGSGCLAISVALECRGAAVLATDISSIALGVACANASSLGAANVTFASVAAHEFVPTDAPDADVIVTNPPYVAERDRSSLAPDVINYEPPDALFGGEDGLDVIRDLIPAAATRLRPGGWLVMEIGAGQAAAVSEMLRGAGLQPLDPLLDLQAVPRVVRARRA